MIKSAKNFRGLSNADAEAEAERRLQKIHNAKRAIMKAEGLQGIEPVEDGRWNGDLKLNEAQADLIAKNAGKKWSLPTPDDFLFCRNFKLSNLLKYLLSGIQMQQPRPFLNLVS